MLPPFINVGAYLKTYFGIAGPSRFGSATTAEQIALTFKADELKGRVAIVTGASSGLGFETARALAVAGLTVVPTARTMALAESTASKLRALAPGARFVPLEMDLGSLASVRCFVDSFHATKLPLHVLVNNAGVAYTPLTFTVDGIEQQLGVNHVGHFLLTELLLPDLCASAPSRIVTLSSLGHYALCYADGIQWNDLDAKKHYAPDARYGQSKLANLMHVKELHRRYHDKGVTSFAVHPGMVFTAIARHQLPAYLSGKGLESLLRIVGFKNVEQGAATSTYCALAPGIESGAYYSDCNVDPCVHPSALDEEQCRRLWDVTEAIIADASKKAPAKQ